MGTRLSVLGLLALLLNGCATASNCAGWSDISLSKQDRLTKLTATQILEHNRQGERQGCWKGR